MVKPKTKSNEITLKKKAFLDAYAKAFGNISQAAKAAGIRRETYYEWIKDAKFKAEVEAIEPGEVFVDFAENALIRRIDAGDTTAIIFALKTKGKKRGYVERTELTGKEGAAIEQVFTINITDD